MGECVCVSVPRNARHTSDFLLARWILRVLRLPPPAFTPAAFALLRQLTEVTLPRFLWWGPQAVNVEERDIGLTIHFVPEGGGEGVSIQEMVRVSVEKNSFRAPCAGTVNITLDNSYSLLRGKSVHIAITVRPHAMRMSVRD